MQRHRDKLRSLPREGNCPKHDTVVACEVIKFYEDAMERFVDLMTPLYPDVDRRRLQMVAHLLVTLTEGSTVLFAGPGDRTVSFEEMLPMLTDVVFGRLTLPASVARSTDAPSRRTGTQR